MKNIYTLIWTALLLSLTLFVSAALAMGENILLGAKSEYAEYSPGEPIQLNLILTNLGKVQQRVDLGGNKTGNIKATIVMDGMTNVVDGYVPAGISSLGVLRIPPHSSVSEVIFLDDFFRPKDAGKYEVSIQISRTDIPPVAIHFEVTADGVDARRRLTDRYTQLISKYKAKETSPQDRDLIRRIFVLSRIPVALEIQGELAQKRDWNYEECGKIVEALVSSKSPQSIGILIQSVLRCPDASMSERAAVLNALRVAQSKDWDGELLKLIEPYIEEIESSIPMDVSD